MKTQCLSIRLPLRLDAVEAFQRWLGCEDDSQDLTTMTLKTGTELIMMLLIAQVAWTTSA